METISIGESVTVTGGPYRQEIIEGEIHIHTPERSYYTVGAAAVQYGDQHPIDVPDGALLQLDEDGTRVIGMLQVGEFGVYRWEYNKNAVWIAYREPHEQH